MHPNAAQRAFLGRVAAAAGILTLFVLFFLLVWKAYQILLVVLFGVLVAVYLDGIATFVCRRTPLARGVALALAVVLHIALVCGLGALIGNQVVEQGTQLGASVPKAYDSFQGWLSEQPWGAPLAQSMVPPKELLSDGQSLQRLTGFASTVLGGATAILVLLAIGLFGAADPKLYTDSAVQLVPEGSRGRVRDLVRHLGMALRRWWLARLASMAIVGVLSTVGLLVMGVPMALALGLLAGLLSFVPYVGPLVSGVPAIAVGFGQSTTTGIGVLVLYGAIQLVESYFVTPVIEKKTIDVPPALLIAVQSLLGVLFGGLGVLLADPVLIILMVCVQVLYVNGVLEEDVRVAGDRTSAS